MFDFIHYFVIDVCHVDGIASRLLTAFLITALIFLSVIIIGWAINKLENLQIRFLSKIVKRETAVNICNYATFPGVCLHELAHAVMAWLTGAKVVEICFFALGDDGRLGYVSYAPRGSKLQQKFQIAATSCAPVLFGLQFLILLVFLLCTVQLPWYSYIAGWYVAISVLDHMSMSSVDIKCYVKSMFIFLPLIFIISYVIILFAYR